eukprot:COSAG06_NODE_653_length_13364_cov_3.847041_8_plen_82_part_00
MKNRPSSSSPAAIFRVAVAAAAAAAANDTAPSLLAAHSSQRAAVLDCGDCSLSCFSDCTCSRHSAGWSQPRAQPAARRAPS